MLFLIKNDSNTIELTVHTSCYWECHSSWSLFSCLFTWDKNTYDYTGTDREPSIYLIICCRDISIFLFISFVNNSCELSLASQTNATEANIIIA